MKKIHSIIFGVLRKLETEVMMSARSPGEGSQEGYFFTVVHFSGFGLQRFSEQRDSGAQF